MKLKTLTLTIGCLCAIAYARAEVTITVDNAAGKLLNVEQIALTDEGANPEPLTVTLDSKGNASFAQAAFPVVINIVAETGPVATRVFSAGDSDKLTLKADGQGNFTATGAPLMEGVTRVNLMLKPYMDKFKDLAEFYNVNPELASAQIDTLSAEINTALRDYINATPAAPEAPYALLMLDGQDFLDVYPVIAAQNGTSILMPSIEQKKQSEEKKMAQERRLQELESGDVPAPAFTLPDLEGKQVSLADFKGKWVVIDFWGSWCRWCIKGFPELKELTQKYSDELVILGVDCRDSQERWREAVKKYDLTWVNVYNDCSTGDVNPLLDAYAVQGFPTKVIVTPQGIIKKIVVGADPSFPQILASLIGK